MKIGGGIEMDITKVATEDLERELKARNKKVVSAPRPLPNPDFSALIDTVVGGTARTVADGYEDEDFKHYVYEAAVEAVYGKAYWAWRSGF